MHEIVCCEFWPVVCPLLCGGATKYLNSDSIHPLIWLFVILHPFANSFLISTLKQQKNWGRKLSISVSYKVQKNKNLSIFTIRDYLTFFKAKWRPSRCPFYNSLIFSIGYLSYSCSNFYKVWSIHLYLQIHLYYQHFQIKNIINAPTQNIISRYEHKYFQVIS